MSMNLALNPSSLRSTIIRVLGAGLVPYVEGSPGVGKSDIMRSIAEELKLKVIDLRLSQCDPTDLMGFPNVQGDKARYVPMETFPVKGDDLPAGCNGWLLFLDEFPSASRAVQAAAYKLVLDKMVGQHELHPSVHIVCAGNKASDKAIVNSLSTATQSRLIHLELAVSLKDWSEWAAGNGIDARIIGFLNYKTSLLHNFSPDHQDKTFPCPRTWSFASRLSTGQDISIKDLPLFAGVVGQGAAQEFIAFAELYQSLPRIEEIVKSPLTVNIADEVSVRYAIATYVADHLNEANAETVTQFLDRLDVEMQVVAYRMAATRKAALIGNQHVYGRLEKLAQYLN
ncbi:MULTISPECIES: AAA family ATPase [Pantoea]|jgi:hypothetical protein|uniref:AAA family ATPase n=1 Tax=Pantoea brenneri TaxID=472694 RepID=A0A7Y6NGY3_9GAMM|nr:MULTISPECIES: AAA family ATPase [Pantoea]MBZ6396990.1 AAA family ATPase [Pantoea sp.]MBZ6440259.1 AAA family ATPase [Pantoea sp.]NUY43477.1 AAA family ATPase [Pantoea brenneri]NUY50957.1 AAA family ATPase [Pantoea brenneri]NUY61312.1 AAA family ATPase [Pantoea brenneri]